MPKVYAFTVTRAATAARCALLLNTINDARKKAKTDFYWEIFVNGADLPANDVVRAAQQSQLIQAHRMYEINHGQHVATNEALAHARDMGADYFLRIDDDVEFQSQGWLQKLLFASTTLDDKFILSPKVRGLRNPPPTEVVPVASLQLEFLHEAIGGICRLHPMALLEDYVSDVRLPLASGDASGIAIYCRNRKIPMAYVSHINVRHAKGTEGQEREDPEHFKVHPILQSVPFIPPWRAP